VLVCGSRTWGDAAAIYHRLARLPHEATIVHGAAPGADTIAGNAAHDLGLKVEAYPADWGKYGKRAGFIRNVHMLDSGIDLVIAFRRDRSPGTSHTVGVATRRGIPVEVHEWPS